MFHNIKGGPQNSQFCPFRQPMTSRWRSADYERECIDERGNNWELDGIFGLNSRYFFVCTIFLEFS